MSEPSDNDLAIRWKAGVTNAYNELVRRHLDPLHRYVLARCGNRSAADDICQEVFLEVCLKISNFNPEHPFAAWFHTIARHKVADHFRSLQPGEEFHPDQHGGEDERHPSGIAEERDSARHAWSDVFKLLPETQATALWLRVQEQRSIADVAIAMVQSDANVKVLLFRARQHLAREWHNLTSV